MMVVDLLRCEKCDFLANEARLAYLTTSSMTLASDSLSFLLRSFLFFAALGSSGRREEGRTPFLIEL